MSKKKKERDEELDDGVDFSIDPENVKDEYTRIPSFIATLNGVYAQSLRIAIMAKLNRDKVYAQIAQDIVADSEKKPAEATIKQMVMLDERYTRAVEQYAVAEERKALAFGRAQAMIAKKEMVVSLGAHVRKELDGIPGGADENDEDRDEDDEGD